MVKHWQSQASPAWKCRKDLLNIQLLSATGSVLMGKFSHLRALGAAWALRNGAHKGALAAARRRALAPGAGQGGRGQPAGVGHAAPLSPAAPGLLADHAHAALPVTLQAYPLSHFTSFALLKEA